MTAAFGGIAAKVPQIGRGASGSSHQRSAGFLPRPHRLASIPVGLAAVERRLEEPQDLGVHFGERLLALLVGVKVIDADRRPGWQLASSYSITSSARTISVGGTLMPSAFAVLRLITKLNLLGA
jgi:hypothetical protein